MNPTYIVIRGVARWGGELSGSGSAHEHPASRDEAQTVIDRVRPIDVTVTGDPGTIAMTLSYGLATWPHHGADVDALMAVADRQLYPMKDARAAGRRREPDGHLRNALSMPLGFLIPKIEGTGPAFDRAIVREVQIHVRALEIGKEGLIV